MKTLTAILRAGVTIVAAGALSLGAISTASAAGTLSGTVVNNQASLTYVPLPDLNDIIGGLGAGELPDFGDIVAGGTLVPVNEPSNNVNFTVDRKVDLSVVQNSSPVAVQPNGPGDQQNYVANLTVTNEGNADDNYRFDLSEVATDGTNQFEFGQVLTLYADDGDVDGEFDSGDTPLSSYDGSTTTYLNTLAAPIGDDTQNNAIADALPAGGLADPGLADDVPHQTVDAPFNLFLVVSGVAVPSTVADGDTARYRVVARSVVPAADIADVVLTTEDSDTAAGGGNDNTNQEDVGNEVVFADGADLDTVDGTQTVTSGAGDADGANGDDGDDILYVVSAAAFSVTKTQEIICDPINGFNGNGDDGTAYYIPGAYVRYTLTVTNADGAAPALITALTDNLSQDLRFDINLIDPTQSGPENCSDDGETEADPATTAGVKNNIKVTVTGSTPSPAYYPVVAPPETDGVPDVPDLEDLAGLADTAVVPGPFILVPGGVAADGSTFGESLLYVGVVPGGPLADQQRLDPTGGDIRAPGQLDANETITIEFNAIVR